MNERLPVDALVSRLLFRFEGAPAWRSGRGNAPLEAGDLGGPLRTALRARAFFRSDFFREVASRSTENPSY